MAANDALCTLVILFSIIIVMTRNHKINTILSAKDTEIFLHPGLIVPSTHLNRPLNYKQALVVSKSSNATKSRKKPQDMRARRDATRASDPLACHNAAQRADPRAASNPAGLSLSLCADSVDEIICCADVLLRLLPLSLLRVC